VDDHGIDRFQTEPVGHRSNCPQRLRDEFIHELRIRIDDVYATAPAQPGPAADVAAVAGDTL